MKKNSVTGIIGVTLAALALPLSSPSAAENSRIEASLQADRPGAPISRYLYGQFSEHLGRGIYDGIWVGPDSPIPNTRGIRNDVVAALKALHVPVVRWPGGCFADEYHWRDGIGPRDKRPLRKNNWWGGALESNAFGTHEFFDFRRTDWRGRLRFHQRGFVYADGDARVDRISDVQRSRQSC